MDKKQLMAWLVPIVAHGLAWIFAAWLGLEAAKASDLGMQVANAIGALVLAVVSTYSSVAGRKKLLAQKPE